MNKKLSLLLAIAAFVSSQSGYAGGGAPKPKVLGYELKCGPGLTNCVQTTVQEGTAPALNKVGDKESWDISGVTTKDFQTISEAKTLAMKIPTSGKQVYTFTPKLGHRLIAGKPVKILFVALDVNKTLPSGTPERVIAEETDAKTKNPKINNAIKVYVMKPGEPQWTEVATYRTPETDLNKLEILNVKVTPDGKVAVPEINGATLNADFGQPG